MKSPSKGFFRGGARLLVLAGLLVVASFGALAQFTIVPGTGLPKLEECSIAWGDYNKDGYLDLLVAGNTDTLNYVRVDSSKYLFRVYRNNGNGTFSDIHAGLSPLNVAHVTWGDYDNDGYLDILASGSDTLDVPVTLLYHNNGNGTFTLNTQSGLVGINHGLRDVRRLQQ